MGALSLDTFEQSSLGKVKYDITDKLEGFNKSFKSSVESVEGKFGNTEQTIGDIVTKNIGFNEAGNAIKEYKVNDKTVMTVERIGDGITETTSFDDNGAQLFKETTDSIKGITNINVQPVAESKGTFTSKLDYLGRPIKNTMEDLQLKKGPREYLKDSLKNESYLEGDQKGHIIADRFSGPPDESNVVAQTEKVNKSQFGEIEGKIAKLKSENPDAKIDLEVKTNYTTTDVTNDGMKRPSSFETKVKVNGKVDKELSKKIYNSDDLSASEKVKTSLKETGVKAKSTMVEARQKIEPHHDAGMESAAIAATVTCAISTVDNVTACMDGEITADQAAINIAKDTGTAGAVGYGAGFVSHAVASSMASSSNAMISSLGNSCVPAAAVSFGIASYDTVMDYAQGEITTEELAYDLGENAAGVAGSMAGTAVGAAVGAKAGATVGAAVGSVVPGAGTAVGAAVGAGVGLVGGMVGYAVATGAYETAIEAAGDAIEEHADEIKQLGDKAQSIANDTIDKAAAFGENAVSDVKEAISNFNIQNKLPW